MFEQVLSLGAWCQVTEQLKRLQLLTTHSPFDWLVTPYDSLLDVIADDGCRFALDVRPTEDRTSMSCSSYGLLYHHEFSRDDAGHVIIDDQHLMNTRAKLLHKMSMFDAACRSGRKTLFVRMGGHAEPPVAWPYLSDDKAFLTADMNRLAEILSRRFPALDYHVMFVNFTETTKFEPVANDRFSTHVIRWPIHHPAGWEGETEAWRDLLHHSGFAFARSETIA